MQKFAIVLTCLACGGHARRVHSSTDRAKARPDSSRSLANLLMTHNAAAAFNPSGVQLAGSAPFRRVSRPAASPRMSADLDFGSILQLADASRMTDQAMKLAAGQELSWFETYVKFVEDIVFFLYDKFVELGVPGAYGLVIFIMVITAKTLALPLNWKQYASSAQIKAMKPQQDLIKKWYGDNKDMLNIQLGVLFDRFDANPLAGCLPSFAQIPIFLGVYYTVTEVAKAKIIQDPFLWIPSLSGPIADRKEGMNWLTQNWIDGHPPLGWHDTLCYLTIPAILVCTQTFSLYFLGTFDALEDADSSSGGGAAKSTGLILRALPLILGYFAMNAPSGLGLYWIFNNILTTLQTYFIKKATAMDEIQFDVDIATLGPRREPLPLPTDASVSDWVEVGANIAEKKLAAAEAASEKSK